jgi:ABC-type polysaccharide/polyol phosphate export permease
VQLQGVTVKKKSSSITIVNETVEEVLKTLIEAFILVAIVVFIFLGNLPATILPVVAVPVSIIASSAVLVVLGHRSTRFPRWRWFWPSASSSTTPSSWWGTSSGSWRRSGDAGRAEQGLSDAG